MLSPDRRQRQQSEQDQRITGVGLPVARLAGIPLLQNSTEDALSELFREDLDPSAGGGFSLDVPIEVCLARPQPKPTLPDDPLANCQSPLQFDLSFATNVQAVIQLGSPSPGGTFWEATGPLWAGGPPYRGTLSATNKDGQIVYQFVIYPPGATQENQFLAIYTLSTDACPCDGDLVLSRVTPSGGTAWPTTAYLSPVNVPFGDDFDLCLPIGGQPDEPAGSGTSPPVLHVTYQRLWFPPFVRRDIVYCKRVTRCRDLVCGPTLVPVCEIKDSNGGSLRLRLPTQLLAYITLLGPGTSGGIFGNNSPAFLNTPFPLQWNRPGGLSSAWSTFTANGVTGTLGSLLGIHFRFRETATGCVPVASGGLYIGEDNTGYSHLFESIVDVDSADPFIASVRVADAFDPNRPVFLLTIME